MSTCVRAHLFLMVFSWTATLAWSANEKRYSEERINGYRVFFIDTTSGSQASFQAAVPVGGSTDIGFKPGLSHFLEHTILTGSKKFPDAEQPFKTIKQLGQANAFTGRFQTGYWWKGESQQLEEVIERYGDLLTQPLFTKEATEQERKRILGESSDILVMPDFGIGSLLQDLVYDGHPFSSNIIGFEDEVKAITADDLRNYWIQEYDSNQLVFSVSANFTDHPEFLDATKQLLQNVLVKRSSAPLTKPSRGTKPFTGPEIAATLRENPRMVQIASSAPTQPVIHFMFHPGSLSMEESDQAKILGMFLTHTLSGGLNDRLQKQGLITGLGAYVDALANRDNFSISIGLTEKGVANLPSIAKQTMEAIVALRKGEISSQLLQLFNDEEAVRRESVGEDALALGNMVIHSVASRVDPAEALDYFFERRRVNKNNISALAKRLFDPNAMDVIEIKHQDQPLAHVNRYSGFSYEYDDSGLLKTLREKLQQPSLGGNNLLVDPGFVLPQIPIDRTLRLAQKTSLSVRQSASLTQNDGLTVMHQSSTYNQRAAVNVAIDWANSDWVEIFATQLLVYAFSYDENAFMRVLGSNLIREGLWHMLDSKDARINFYAFGNAGVAATSLLPMIDRFKNYQPSEEGLHRAYAQIKARYMDERSGFPSSVASQDLRQVLSSSRRHANDIRKAIDDEIVSLDRLREVAEKIWKRADITISGGGNLTTQEVEQIGRGVKLHVEQPLTAAERWNRKQNSEFEVPGALVRTQLENASNGKGDDAQIGIARAFAVPSQVGDGPFISVVAQVLHDEIFEENSERRGLGYAQGAQMAIVGGQYYFILNGQVKQSDLLETLFGGWQHTMRRFEEGDEALSQAINRATAKDRQSLLNGSKDWLSLVFENLRHFDQFGTLRELARERALSALEKSSPAQMRAFAQAAFKSAPVATAVQISDLTQIPAGLVEGCGRSFHDILDLTRELRQ